MYTISTIKHSVITSEKLEMIIRIKSTAWNYSLENQLSWIEDNISKEDIHVILNHDDIPVAYLNLIEIELIINEERKRSYGIGNVCSLIRGRGYGKELMLQVNRYLEDTNNVGLLFCKEPLVSFYNLCKWRTVDKDILLLNIDNKNIETLIFNQQQEIARLQYTGKSF